MKYGKWIVGILFSILLIMTILISSVDIAVYADYGYFEREYIKYDVNNSEGIVNMDMSELMDVTKDMMSYLRGNRDNLIVNAQIDGVQQEFFNNIEKSHMADCRNLFVAAIWIRRISIVLMFLIILDLLYMKVNWKKVLGKSIIYTSIGFLTVTAIIGAIMSIDFNAAFTKFHQIVFTNDMWLLDEATCRLINIVPEGFFIDTAIRIGVVFVTLMIILIGIAFFISHDTIKAKNTHNGGTYEQG